MEVEAGIRETGFHITPGSVHRIPMLMDEACKSPHHLHSTPSPWEHKLWDRVPCWLAVPLRCTILGGVCVILGFLAAGTVYLMLLISAAIFGMDDESSKSEEAHSAVEPLLHFVVEATMLAMGFPVLCYELCYCRTRWHAMSGWDFRRGRMVDSLPSGEEDYASSYCNKCWCGGPSPPVLGLDDNASAL